MPRPKTRKPEAPAGELTAIPEYTPPARATKAKAGVPAGDKGESAAPDLSHIAEQLRSLVVPVGELEFDPANARKHPEKNLDALRGSLKVYGQVKPVVVRKDTGTVIAGNGTLAAALALGWTHLAAVYVSMDAATAAGYSIADNRTSDLATWDKEALDKLLREVSTGNDERLDLMLSELAEAEGLYLGGEPEPDAHPEENLELEADEDALDLLFKSPFPYFGGKARVARIVWKGFGAVQNYFEPFFGSGAVLLNRPEPFEGSETVNDYDGLLANFWRALQADPAAVAKWADWPVNENDLHARHAWLVAQKDALQAMLEGDPDYFDAKIAGWWVWGMACWIGSGFCSGNGPWQVVEAADGTRQLVHLGDAGQGVNRKRVHLSNAGQGVNRKRVHLSNAGRGVNRQRVHLGDAGRGVNRQRVEEAGEGKPGLGECGLLAWMQALAARIKRVRVCCGDWTRVCGGDSGDAIRLFFSSGPTCGIFLDPPYADTADRESNLYRKDSLNVAHAVREWAIAHGDDKRLRICLAGYEGEHKMPGSWRCVAWKAPGGYGRQGEGRGKVNCSRERLWFSPHCLTP